MVAASSPRGGGFCLNRTGLGAAAGPREQLCQRPAGQEQMLKVHSHPEAGVKTPESRIRVWVLAVLLPRYTIMGTFLNLPTFT